MAPKTIFKAVFGEEFMVDVVLFFSFGGNLWTVFKDNIWRLCRGPNGKCCVGDVKVKKTSGY
jgi:hypothetical protein